MSKLVVWILLIFGTMTAAGNLPGEEPGPRPATATTLILVRHAEKEAAGTDPALTHAGRARALELARILGDAEIEAVFATQYRRTRDTARVVAEGSGLDVTVDPAGGQDLETYARGLVRRIMGRHAGGTILVVGHSNTLPALIGALGARTPPVIDERTHDDLFVVTVSPDGGARLLHLHYGEPSQKATSGG